MQRASQTPFIVVLAQSIERWRAPIVWAIKSTPQHAMHSTFLAEFIILRAQSPIPQNFKCRVCVRHIKSLIGRFEDLGMQPNRCAAFQFCKTRRSPLVPPESRTSSETKAVVLPIRTRPRSLQLHTPQVYYLQCFLSLWP